MFVWPCFYDGKPKNAQLTYDDKAAQLRRRVEENILDLGCQNEAARGSFMGEARHDGLCGVAPQELGRVEWLPVGNLL